MDIVGYIANAFIFAAAVTVTSAPRFSLKPHIFFLFLIGHILWLGIALHRADSPLATLNAFFVLLDCYAIFVRLRKKTWTLQ